MPGLSVHLFNTSGTDYAGKNSGGSFSLDGAIMAEFFINETFSLQTGFLYTTDIMTVSGQKNVYDNLGVLKYSYNTVESFSIKSLLIPLLAGINFYPSVFSLSFYGGLYMDIPVTGVYKDSFAGTEETFNRNVVLGYAIGGSAGIKLGPGIMFCDLRYMGDFTQAKATANNKVVGIYKRHIVAFGIGYKIGFINQER
jgi:hypothetical protein